MFTKICVKIKIITKILQSFYLSYLEIKKFMYFCCFGMGSLKLGIIILEIVFFPTFRVYCGTVVTSNLLAPAKIFSKISYKVKVFTNNF